MTVTTKHWIGAGIASVLLLAFAIANADPLPTPTSDNDPKPPVAGPVASQQVINQAGVGGETAYGRAGVLELGGSAGFIFANDLQSIRIAPSIGMFITDNFQLSAIPSLAYVGTSKDSSMLLGALIEPSYHLPFTNSTFGFMGLGMGASWVEDFGGGIALAPRVGTNILVGRSGVLTPALSWQYTTHDVDNLGVEESQATVSSALMFNVGYTVMW